MSNWKKPTQKEKLDKANEHYRLPKKKGKHLDWWDKLKIAVHEGENIRDAEFEIIEPKQLPPPETPKP